MLNQRLANELQANYEKFKKCKVYSSFRDNLADMQLTSKCDERIKFLFYVINVFNKYAHGLFVSLKDKNGISVTNVFQKDLDKSGLKPNEISLDKYI